MEGRLKKSLIKSASKIALAEKKTISLADGGRLFLNLSRSIPNKGVWYVFTGRTKKQKRIRLGIYQPGSPLHIDIKTARVRATAIKHNLPISPCSIEEQKPSITLAELARRYLTLKQHSLASTTLEGYKTRGKYWIK
ncbi:hypothetical protein CJP74_06115 [Psittacicella melopsittaci]|uniref:Integrase DNA-binding domain-containing protein n=1 Tax=Psittacicella melopsittaci TaxID=2028576 RepID=A0A3A1Y716_9GAMM|nr:hypothetical protein [Psittacicella melopsittaci]RIY31854.1 hypothetical protein CJP74_06115 [Psittacicella melopsittaci]